ncbi:MAG: glycosyltransferase [Epulopiscium sp.]|uniref:Glycosyl transferase n=2 Tax=Clostridium isatidis TaxID=182773 RepID=A0A343JC58_9CLOT|nr:glycosyl transferase [Clostridium isatidis]NMA85636.1 glycosyltransferase [Candidatus Epulonipiscium sp.]
MISICMIVKNESKVLEKSLESIKDYNFEIIIVDTGSSDNTKEIARKYTDKVYDFKWCNDFSQARNFSISKAANDFVLVLDADEVIIDIDLKEIEKLINKNSEKVGRIIIKNEYYRDGNKFTYKEYVNRLFNKNLFIYKGLIHEQVTTQNGKLFRTYNLPLEIHHIGYNNEEITRKNKIIRNIEMLKEALRENSEDPYIYYQLGKSYYMNDNFKEAKYNFETALSFNLDTKFEYVQDLIETYGYSLIKLEEYKNSMKLLNLYNEYKNSADFIFLIALIYMNNGFFNEAIIEFENAKRIEICKMDGVNDYLANYNIGVILECLGNKEKAIKYYKICNNYENALRRIEYLNSKK